MKKTLFAASLFVVPFVVAAQGNLGNIQQLILSVGNIVGLLIPILIGVAMIFFFWGLVKYIRNSGEGHADGVKMMVAGIVSLFVMVSIWGIVRFAQSSLGIDPNAQNIPAPRFPRN